MQTWLRTINLAENKCTQVFNIDVRVKTHKNQLNYTTIIRRKIKKC